VNPGGNGDFDRLLRDTVRELATAGRPVDLSASALRTARRIRTRRAVSTVSAVVVLLVGLAFGVSRARDTDRSVPPADPGPSSAPASTGPSASATPSQPAETGTALIVLPGGWMIRAAPGPVGAITYDDQQGRYRLMGAADRVVPSPNGAFLAEVNAAGELAVTATADGRRVASRTNVTVASEAYPVWSPDSSRLAYVVSTVNGAKVTTVSVSGTESMSDSVPCDKGCTVKWLDNGQRVRVYAGSNRVEVDIASGAVGTPSAPPDDPCGARFAGYRIDNQSWLCVTATGFAVTGQAGAVTQRVPFPTTIDGIGVGEDIDGYVLFRPK
jgi:hypothetical protein